MDQILQSIYDGILNGDRDEVKEQVSRALDGHVAAAEILNKAMIAAMEEVGRLYEQGDYFVPEMLIAARAMKEGLTVLKPALRDANVALAGKVAAGTVKGDMHDIGKNLVCIMLEGAGFEIIDLGTDVPPEKFVEAARNGADIIAMSALLTTTMGSMKITVQALQAAGLRERVKVMVGGAPVTAEYARLIGADGYSPDASQAVALARSLVA
jgi:5-methyltetrahydrofolate--homocysteine methyltransferase